MLQLIGGRWPEEWQPRGWGTADYEPFASWWERWADQFLTLEPRVLEQWVHKHWTNSEYFGFHLQNFRCQVQRLATGVLVSDVGSVDNLRAAALDPEFIFESFNRPFGGPEPEPMKTMNLTGSWDMPVLLVSSISRFVHDDSAFPDFGLWLLEGHLRLRYLRALAARGQAATHHEALVLIAD